MSLIAKQFTMPNFLRIKSQIALLYLDGGGGMFPRSPRSMSIICHLECSSG